MNKSSIIPEESESTSTKKNIKGTDKIDLTKYVCLTSANFYKKWTSADGSCEGIIFGVNVDKFKVWSVLYIMHRKGSDDISWYPTKTEKEYALPITGPDAKALYNIYIQL